MLTLRHTNLEEIYLWQMNLSRRVMERTLQTRHLSMIALGEQSVLDFYCQWIRYFNCGTWWSVSCIWNYGNYGLFPNDESRRNGNLYAINWSFSAYSTKFVDPALGFALGWNYWFNWAITIPVDVTTAGIVMNYWLPNVPGWIFSVTVMALIFLNQLFISTILW